MRETKLILLFQHFKREELKAFDKFIDSPYFNTNETRTKLWLLLKKYAPDFDAPQLANEKVFKKLFPKTVYNEKRLRQLRSNLLKLVEEFLAIERFKKDDFRFKKEVADAYLEKGMKDNFEKKSKELQKSFEPLDFLPAPQLHQKLSLHHQAYFNELYVKGDNPPTDLAACTELLEQYYIQQKLFYSIEWLSSSKRYNLELPPIIETYLEQFNENSEKVYNKTIHSIFENAIKLFLQKETEKAHVIFIKLKNQFVGVYEKVDSTSKNIILRLLINYCIHASNKRNNTSKDIFELFRLGISDGAIFYKNLLTNISFINIVTTALKVNETEWVIDFIEKERHRLYEPQKEVYLVIANASIYFYQEKFESCLVLLSKMPTTDLTIMEVVRRSLKLKAAFECYLQDENYKSIVYADIESLSKFINRKKILSNNKKKGYLTFLNFLKNLLKYKEKEDTKINLSNLRGLLLKQQIIPSDYRKWLLKHITKFEKVELQRATPKQDLDIENIFSNNKCHN